MGPNLIRPLLASIVFDAMDCVTRTKYYNISLAQTTSFYPLPTQTVY